MHHKYLVLRSEQLNEVSLHLRQSFRSFSLSSEVKKGSLSSSGAANISALSWEMRDVACISSNSTLLETMHAGVLILIFVGTVAHRNY